HSRRPARARGSKPPQLCAKIGAMTVRPPDAPADTPVDDSADDVAALDGGDATTLVDEAAAPGEAATPGETAAPRETGAGADPRAERPSQWPAVAVAVVALAAYLTPSLARWHRWDTPSWDNGIFEQAIRGWAGLGWPVVDIKGDGYIQL